MLSQPKYYSHLCFINGSQLVVTALLLERESILRYTPVTLPILHLFRQLPNLIYKRKGLSHLSQLISHLGNSISYIAQAISYLVNTISFKEIQFPTCIIQFPTSLIPFSISEIQFPRWNLSFPTWRKPILVCLFKTIILFTFLTKHYAQENVC